MDNLNSEELIQKFITDIKTDKNFENFFKGYTPSSVDSFLNFYATRKFAWTLNAPIFKNKLESVEIEWENTAMERLQEIQQVKLFLFQCNFRAGAIQEPVPGVRTIFDFMYWQNNILNARFLEPVTENDIRLYSDYLMSFQVDHNPFEIIEGWQDFDAIREAYNDEENSEVNVPEWYSFYFSRTGHGIELTLPDIKKEKDYFYFYKGNDERMRLAQEARARIAAPLPVPEFEKGELFIDYSGNNLTKFTNLFEDKKNREMYEVHKRWMDFSDKEDMLKRDIDMLMYANEEVPIDAGNNWVEAIQLAASRYRSIKIGASLPAAYEQYKMSLELNITFPEKENSRRERDSYNSLILLGRKLKGEPENFEY